MEREQRILNRIERWYCGKRHPVCVLTVLVQGGRGDDYAAYQGCGPDAWVAAHGQKLMFVEAKREFPFIEERFYRR